MPDIWKTKRIRYKMASHLSNLNSQWDSKGAFCSCMSSFLFSKHAWQCQYPILHEPIFLQDSLKKANDYLKEMIPKRALHYDDSRERHITMIPERVLYKDDSKKSATLWRFQRETHHNDFKCITTWWFQRECSIKMIPKEHHIATIPKCTTSRWFQRERYIDIYVVRNNVIKV